MGEGHETKGRSKGRSMWEGHETRGGTLYLDITTIGT